MPDLNLLLIQPSQITKEGRVLKTKRALVPGLTLPLLAGLTPKNFNIKIIDEIIEDIDFDLKVDLVAITSITVQIERAYQIADKFRVKGKIVIMGGHHVSSLPEEAMQHSNSIVIGEADYIWRRVLQDFMNGELKSIYRSETRPDLNSLPLPRLDLIRSDKYIMPFVPVQTTRGCPYKCEFCSVTEFYGYHFRHRPIEDVIRDIKASKSRYIFFIDDNICADINYCKELFEKVKYLKIRWMGQCNIGFARFPNLVKLAAESGCINMYIGIESIRKDNLELYNKSFNEIELLPNFIKVFLKNKITIMASVIFGLDNDDESIFDETVRILRKNRISVASFYLLTPRPGTRLFNRLEKENRILHKNWSLYNTTNVVFRPKNINNTALELGLWKAYEKFYSIPSIVQRLFLPIHQHLNIILPANIVYRVNSKKRHHPMTG